MLSLQNIKMGIQGFKKVALKDSKKVLNETNNFKWVKEKGNKKITILPSGTKVTKTFDNSVFGLKGDTKLIEKANGDVIEKSSDYLYTSVRKNDKLLTMETRSERELKELKKESEKLRAQYTKNEIILPDGRVVKRTFDENKKLIRWSRNGSGENTQAVIERPLNGVLGVSVHKSYGDGKYSTKSSSKIFGRVKDVQYDLKNNENLTMHSTLKIINPETKKLEVMSEATTNASHMLAKESTNFSNESVKMSFEKAKMEDLFA